MRTGGQPVGFGSSAVRNLMRLVDGLPLSYVPAIVSILVTERNQRLGDLAAGTIVVREPRRPRSAPARVSATFDERLAYWDVSAVTDADLVAVRRFLERRHDLVPDARARLAEDLAARLDPKVGGASPDLEGPEIFLERLAAAKAARK